MRFPVNIVIKNIRRVLVYGSIKKNANYRLIGNNSIPVSKNSENSTNDENEEHGRILQR